MPTFSQITPCVSMVDTDQEKGLSILSAKNLETTVWKKRRKKRKRKKIKKKGKRKKEIQELTKAVLNAAFYKIECRVLGCSNPASLFIFGCLWWILKLLDQNYSQIFEEVHFFRFSKLFFKHFVFTFTMVIKRFRPLCGESAFGDQSASSMSKCGPAWDLTTEMHCDFKPAVTRKSRPCRGTLRVLIKQIAA